MDDYFDKDKDWIVMRCTLTGDILNYISQALLQEDLLKKYNVSLSVSVPGFVQVSFHQNTSNDKLIIKQVLRELAKKGKEFSSQLMKLLTLRRCRRS